MSRLNNSSVIDTRRKTFDTFIKRFFVYMASTDLFNVETIPVLGVGFLLLDLIIMICDYIVLSITNIFNCFLT